MDAGDKRSPGNSPESLYIERTEMKTTKRFQTRAAVNTASLLAGFCLDRVLGDPEWLTHPVVIMGRYISRFEKQARRWTEKAELPEEKAERERKAGALLAASLPLLTFGVTSGACRAARALHPAAEPVLKSFWCGQALAAKGLREESTKVQRALEQGELPAARRAVARIVGRDTESLSAEGVAKAAVETVAENFSDGVAAPMLYMYLGGAPLALTYKAVNTMDSMVAYRNEKYLNFGRAAAKLDDAANFLPSRIAALFWIAASGITCGGRGHLFAGRSRGGEAEGCRRGTDVREALQSAGNAYRIWRRDAGKHVSPNAGQTEAACAGALGIQLGGDAWYFGELHKKAALGDAKRPCGAADIERANRIMYAAEALLCGVLACL